MPPVQRDDKPVKKLNRRELSCVPLLLFRNALQFPFFGMQSTFKQKAFVAMNHLEPVESERVEVIDTTTHEVRRKDKKSWAK